MAAQEVHQGATAAQSDLTPQELPGDGAPEEQPADGAAGGNTELTDWEYAKSIPGILGIVEFVCIFLVCQPCLLQSVLFACRSLLLSFRARLFTIHD